MPTLDEAFSQVRDALLERFKAPASQFERLDPFASMVAVALERNGAGSHLHAAVGALDKAGFLTWWELREAELFDIADALREAGLDLSAQRLALLPRLAHWLVHDHDGDADSLFEPSLPVAQLRDELSAINGLGAPGADAVLLFALDRLSYPVDRATYRVLARHGWLDASAGYDEARDAVVDHATDFAGRTGLSATGVLKDLAHGMERLGRKYCRAAAPLCEGCPLEPLLPDGGPHQADA